MRVRILLLLVLLPGRACGEDIVLGMSAAFTGPSRGLGAEMYRGAMAWFTEVNERGGVHGRKIILRAYDDGYEPGPALANTRRLVQDDRALLLFGYVGTPTVTRVMPLLRRYRDQSVYLFCPFTGAEPMRSGPYADQVLHLRASYREETAGLVDNFVKVGRRRIAVFYQIDAYGRSGWDGVRRALKVHDLTMTGEATYRRGAEFSESMTEQVHILRKSSPDVVICIGAYAACAAFVRDARDTGWNVPIANVSFVGSENLLALLRQQGKEKGKDYIAGLLNSQVVPSPADTSLPGVKLYRELMDRHAPKLNPGLVEADYRPLPYGFTSLEGFLDARLVVEVLQRLGKDLDRRKLVETVERIEELDLGLNEKITFGPGQRQAHGKVYYSVAEGDRFVPLSDWGRWKR